MRGWSLLLGGVLALIPAVWGPALFLSLREPAPPAPSGGPAAERGGGLAGASSQEVEPAAFASAEGVLLHLPAYRVRGVAFHEAALPGAHSLRPFGRCRPCRHHRFSPPAADGSGLRYAVMPPRGRGTSPTSAVDVVVGPGTSVRSPVTGTVRSVERYRLYGRHPDTRVVIRPEGAAGIHVVLLHLWGVTLSEGDRVEATVTPVGRARRLPFPSQVDRFVPGGLPHVHLEVVDARARRQATKQG